ncbi:Bug family tripartite tricarboxylate transporter substrate binding protein [Schauerella aestuarii]|uniref:Bug family tripartite tricarboxylate transporter substrate binding protein n=1 Tax=Schauerella aestuarii TaxID=2511204 RepID=UPI001370530F|nr:tripartite tricarboxylate transporter substrate binding protein [Achromobacter aestuarii]MYZ41870.1 tripartite tricarboxylate transporter substrate binding protein [Achromobacter aestuarii]
MSTIKGLVRAALATCTVFAACATAQAAGPVRLVVAFPPGGPVDLVGRVLAERLSKDLGENVIVENRAGANGNIAASYVAKSTPDGSVLFLTSVGAVAISPSLYASLPYDAAKDFAPISRVVNNATVFVVNPAESSTDAADFVKRSQASKQSVAIGSSGVGSIPHLTLALFQESSKANVLHVPYKGAAPVINDVLGNQITGFFGDVPGLIGHIQAGKLKPLGIAAPKRHPLLPNVKTLSEQGIANVESNNWYGLLAPAGTPPATIDKLNQAVRTALADPATRKRFEDFGAEAAPSTPEELAALIQSDREKWGAVIRKNDIRPE